MTQIFSVVTRRCVFHVSDRLLSQKTTGSARPFDTNSNKVVVFRANDAQVVGSYTGRAYLDSIPSDMFIAQSLLGSPLSGSAFESVGRAASWTDIGRSVERLRADLSSAFLRLPKQDRTPNFEVSILGWRQRIGRNRRITPVIWELKRSPGAYETEFRIVRHQRWWRWDWGFTLTSIPTLRDEGLVSSMLGRIRESGNESPEVIKRVLLDALHRCTLASPEFVGRSCLMVTLTPTASPQARLRYVVDTGRPDDLAPDGHGYSPWVIDPPMVFAPAIMRSTTGTGGWTASGSSFSWVIEGLQPVVGPRRVSQSAQKRPPDPQRR